MREINRANDVYVEDADAFEARSIRNFLFHMRPDEASTIENQDIDRMALIERIARAYEIDIDEEDRTPLPSFEEMVEVLEYLRSIQSPNTLEHYCCGMDAIAGLHVIFRSIQTVMQDQVKRNRGSQNSNQ